MHIKELDTPCLLLDRKAVVKNINRIQKIANKQNISLRPHIKTHKSTYLFNLQQQAGAVGITASKITEAIPFIDAGVNSVKLVYPVVDKNKLEKFISYLKAQNKLIELTLCIDSIAGFEAAKSAATEMNYPLSIQIIINTGSERCGINPSDSAIDKLAINIDKCDALNLTGIVTHNGLTYSAKNKKHIGKMNASEIKQLLNVRKRLVKKGILIKEISAGSTPGVLGGNQTLTGVTELRPGNYIFMDRTPFELGLINKKQIALTVLTQVISENDNYYIIDAGKKVMSSDKREGVDDFGLVYPWKKFGKKKYELRLVKMSEEHGFVRKRKGIKHQIGDKLRIIPNHSCVVANLASEYCMINKMDFLKTISIEAAKASHGINQF